MSEILRYQPGDMDWLLLNWMSRMQADGDLEHTLSKGLHTPLAFLSFFTQRALYYRVTELGNISYAAWFEQIMGNCFMGFYIAPEVRDQHEEKVYFLFDMLNLAFVSGAKVVVGLIQERVHPEITQKFIKLHLRFGYEYCGRVPHLFDQKDCYVVAYTVESWEGGQDGRWQTKWRRDRQSASAAAAARANVNGTEPAEQQFTRSVG